MMKQYLIEAASGLAIWCGDAAPILTETSVICGEEIFLCYSSETAYVLEADAVEDFSQRKYLAIGKNLVVDPAWIEPTVDLAPIKFAKNLQINEWRQTANRSTFPYAGKLIACDDLSRSDIDAVAGSVAMNNALPVGFPNAWKSTDNTLIPIPDIATFKQMYNAMMAQGTANFARSQQLKAALASAETAQEIEAIKWEV